ncbi:hypothetical protein LOZ58_006208 [Ophidiomyces ophidiicola]|nr:hypothetical protein LOZ58_006208 [Ophidiomyces ophidiicola]
MAHTPSEPFTLTGGCFCKAIRYKITAPARGDRPGLPGVADTRVPPLPGKPISPPVKQSDQPRIPTKLPVIDFDHCADCRHASGSVAQCWFICPPEWVEWTLRHRPGFGKDEEGGTEVRLTTLEACVSSTVEASTTESTIPATTYMAHYKSSSRVTRTFCVQCGTNLTYHYARDPSSSSSSSLPPFPALIDITTGSLDDGSLVRVHVDRQTWWDSGVGWVKRIMRWGDGGLMKHPKGTTTQEIVFE